ncbi:MAG TPA: DUF2332 family protein [Rhizobiaceae bacterium]|nr:DUF2332 family protein [Rhizobiaceae bacterium]
MGESETSATREDYIRSHFRGQAKACDVLGSPFTASLCRAIADVIDDGTAAGRAALGWPGNPRDDALALRFCGALHALVLTKADSELAAAYPPTGATEERLRDLLPRVLARNTDRILYFLESAPQTNEVARSGMLLPGFLTIARETTLPLALFEIGSSAGLNLLFDRFYYRYGDTEWGDSTSPVRLAPEVRGKTPPLTGELKIVSREGCDLSPVDVSDPQARLRLRSYIWPDQALRQRRINAAIELARAAKISVEKSDALNFIRRRLASTKTGVTQTLFHSIMWQYMPESVRREIETEVTKIGAAANKDVPLAWLRMEPLDTKQPHATLTLTLWPGGETRHLAKCDYHGRWIEWIG